MWYFEETKRFWRAGYRLFHGKFLSFMSGPKAMGQLVIGNKELGAIDLREADLNVAVPARNSLISNGTDLPTTLKPGVIGEALNAIKKSKPTDICMMCVDGKKVTPGLDKDFGDVDMFMFEKGPTISDKREKIKIEKNMFRKCKVRLRNRKWNVKLTKREMIL